MCLTGQYFADQTLAQILGLDSLDVDPVEPGPIAQSIVPNSHYDERCADIQQI